MRIPRVYFAHPTELMRPGRDIAKRVVAAGFDVVNPFDTKETKEWLAYPSSRLAREIWDKDFGEILRADALLAWLPRNAFTGLWREGSHPPIGTQMEIMAALQLYPRQVYIVTDIFHPFLAASGRCFPTIERAIEEMRKDFGGLKGEMQAQVADVTNLTDVTNREPERDFYSWKFPKMAVKRTPPRGGGVKERGIEEAITETWRLIDIAKAHLADPQLKENDKIRWAGVLASTIGALNKLLWKAGESKLDDDDLANILSKIPDKYAKMIKRRLARDKLPQTSPTKSASFEGIERGDIIQIEWLDASLSRNVTKISNRVIATYKTTVGRFVGVFRESRHGAEHVIIQHEADDAGVSDISSIPAAIVVGVKKLSPKTALKNLKRGTDAQWTQPTGGGGVKIMTRRARR